MKITPAKENQNLDGSITTTDSSKIIVLYVSPHVDGYGADRSLLYNVVYLKNKGFIEPFFIVPREGLLTEVLKENNIVYFVANFKMWATGRKKNIISLIKFIIKYVYNSLRLLRLYSRISALNIRLVHTNDLVTDFGIRLAKKLKVPHIMHSRALLYEQFGISFDLPEKLAILYVNKNSSKVIFNSKTVEQRYSYYFNKEKIELIHSAIYFSMKRKPKTFMHNGKVRFLFLGRFEPAKDPLTLIHAGNELKNMGISDFEIHLYGAPNSYLGDNYLKKMNDSIDENSLRDCVFIHSFDKSINAKMKSFDVGIFCSPNEGIARVVVEYMINSMPVIATRTGGVLELIENGLNGFLYTPQKSVELAEAMTKFIEDRSLIEKLGTNAFNSVSDDFSIEKTSEQILKVYKESLQI